MATYRWTGDRPLRRNDGDDVEPGDEFEFDRGGGDDEDDAVESAFGDLVERVDGLLDGTVNEVRDELETGEYDDQLDAIAERADRAGVEDAVEDRRG